MAYEHISIQPRVMTLDKVLDTNVRAAIAREEQIARSAPMVLRELQALIEFIETDNPLTTQPAVFRCVLSAARSVAPSFTS